MVNIQSCFKISLGDFTYIDENAETYEEFLNAFSRIDLEDISAFVGHALHMQQQMLGKLYYIDSIVYALHIEDTCGKPVYDNTRLVIKKVTENVKFKELV